MTGKKFNIAVLMFVSLALNTTGAGAGDADLRERARGGEQSKSQTQTPATTPATVPDGEGKLKTDASGEIKELAAGGNGSIREPFIFIARDAETYASLRALQDKLPELGADFFKSNAVIAAFLGERRTGGYGVSITRAANRLLVTEKTPPKGAMVTMALTAPFQIVSAGVREESPLALELDATWQAAARPYKVEAGEFMPMGSPASRPERASVKGDIRIMRHGQLATLTFALHGTSGEEGVHTLQDTVSGTITPEGVLTLTRLNPGSFAPPPRYPLRASGNFRDDEGALSLSFEVTQAKADGGYGGQGKLEATATAPPSKKRSGDEVQPM